MNEIRDHKSPNTLEYVFGLRESFRPTTISISLIITKAFGISWLLCAPLVSASSDIWILVLSLKLISFSERIMKNNINCTVDIDMKYIHLTWKSSLFGNSFKDFIIPNLTKLSKLKFDGPSLCNVRLFLFICLGFLETHRQHNYKMKSLG